MSFSFIIRDVNAAAAVRRLVKRAADNTHMPKGNTIEVTAAQALYEFDPELPCQIKTYGHVDIDKDTGQMTGGFSLTVDVSKHIVPDPEVVS